MRRLLLGILFLIILGLTYIGVFLGEAHWEIRTVKPALPTVDEVRTALDRGEGPVRIRYINTASQAAAGRKVIHPSYVLEWADGRVFLVEVGMDRIGAAAFGQTMEQFLGSDPIEIFGSVAEQMGDGVSNIGAVAVTHLHTDHTGGIGEICAAHSGDVKVFQTAMQASKGNYMTAPGQGHLDNAPCAEQVVLEDGPIYEFDTYPGLVAVSAGGHTPGSTVYFAQVGDDIWVMAGDLAWTLKDILTNTAKPIAYSMLVVPEDGTRMEGLRLWLKALDQEPDVNVVVSHGEQALFDTGMERFTR